MFGKLEYEHYFFFQVMLNTLEDAVFHREKFPAEFYARDTHSRCMLALGAVSHKLMKEGRADKARSIMTEIHSQLGLHGTNNYYTFEWHE